MTNDLNASPPVFDTGGTHMVLEPVDCTQTPAGYVWLDVVYGGDLHVLVPLNTWFISASGLETIGGIHLDMSGYALDGTPKIGVQIPVGVCPFGCPPPPIPVSLVPPCATQVPWHLDRIDQESLPLDGAEFAQCPTPAVTPSTVFIISNGINTNLAEFGGRASVGYGSPVDLTGQGTYLASLVGGAFHGVDKTANLVSVQGYGPSGSLTAVMDALEWVNDQGAYMLPNVEQGVVLIDSSSMSFHVLENYATIGSMEELSAAGLTVVVAAGDSSASDCDFVGSGSAIVVGATDRDDAKASFSNYGTCFIDLFAPGVDVRGAAHGGGAMTQSSTDASAAIVAGVASKWLSVNPAPWPDTAKAALVAEATVNAITFPVDQQSTNKLVRVCGNQVPWHLDRIDQANLPLDGGFSPDCPTGAPTTVYIVDTGIDTTHPEFGDRASVGWGSTTDPNGHGTGIASLVGGSIHGVDKTAKLVSIQVIGASGSGSSQDIVAGLQWIRGNYQLVGGNAVVCLGFGGGYDAAIEAEIDLLIHDINGDGTTGDGLTVVVAAGNGNQDACSSFPGSMPDTITVGATDQFDARAYFSSYGTCVDLLAPGVDVERAVTGGVVTQGGTHSSSAIAAGAASLWLRVNGPATPAVVKAGLIADATPGALTGLNGSPNLLLRVSDGCPVIPSPCAGATGSSSPQTFLINGPPSGTDWWWSLSNSPVAASYVHVPGVSDDYNGDGSFDVKDVIDAFKDSINAFAAANNWLGVSAKRAPIGTNEYLSVSSTCSLSLFVSDTGVISDFCEVVPFGTCSFNPQIELIPLPGFDCNENGIDDELDLASGLSQDANANGILDECEPSAWSNEGFALAGVNGEPLFVGSGDMTAGSSNPLDLSNAAPMAYAGLFWNLESDPTPFWGGTVVPGFSNDYLRFETSAAGQISLSLPVPPGLPAGIEIWLQWLLQDEDSVAGTGVAMSNAIKAVTQ